MDTILDLLKEVGVWVLGIIGLLLIISVLYLLGRTGVLFRKGLITKKSLFKVKQEAKSKGYSINEKWHEYNSKATIWIAAPLIGWLLFYSILFFFVNTTIFLISLTALVVPILGYFGVLFTPSSEPDDYF